MHKKYDHIVESFRQSFADSAFSRSEKRDIQQQIRDAQLDFDDIGFLRRQIFSIARDLLKNHEPKGVMDWLERANQSLWTSFRPCNNEVHFSPGEHCRTAILQQLSSARKTLDLCVFTITDNTISDTVAKCHEKGIHIRLISDNDKSQDLGSDIKRLAMKGVTVRLDATANHMHHKFAIIDECKLITGSYNWTRSAADFNHENILVTNDSATVSNYTNEFNKLWDTMTPYRKPN